MALQKCFQVALPKGLQWSYKRAFKSHQIALQRGDLSFATSHLGIGKELGVTNLHCSKLWL